MDGVSGNSKGVNEMCKLIVIAMSSPEFPAALAIGTVSKAGPDASKAS